MSADVQLARPGATATRNVNAVYCVVHGTDDQRQQKFQSIGPCMVASRRSAPTSQRATAASTRAWRCSTQGAGGKSIFRLDRKKLAVLSDLSMAEKNPLLLRPLCALCPKRADYSVGSPLCCGHPVCVKHATVSAKVAASPPCKLCCSKLMHDLLLRD